MEKARHIKRTLLADIVRQNQEMRQLLTEWPARKVMMEYEKEWDEKRAEFLDKNETIDPLQS